jgi:hypothetical protein
MRQETDIGKRLIACFIFAAVLDLGAGKAAAQARGPEALGFTKHFTVEITNPSPLALDNHAIIIDVADIRAAVASDFNTYMYAFFDNSGGEYALVVSQADDLNKDRYHDEIVIVRTLPPSSTTRLVCYYTPDRSFQLMPAQKAFARGGWETGGAEAGWESNLAAYKFVHGRIGFLAKLQAGLILMGFPLAETKKQDWGKEVLEIGDSAGLGGLSLWDGTARLPLFGPSAPRAKLTVISPGPVRALVKAEYPAVKAAGTDIALTVFFSAFADNSYSRQDVVIASKPGLPVILSPGIQKLAGETPSLDSAKGFLAVWGKGADKAGEIGLAAVFTPAEFSGLDDSGSDRAIKLAGQAGRKLIYWVAGGWERGVRALDVPDARGWTRHVGDLAVRLLAPVKVEFKAK